MYVDYEDQSKKVSKGNAWQLFKTNNIFGNKMSYVICMKESTCNNFPADLLVSFQEVISVLCDIFAPSVHGD